MAETLGDVLWRQIDDRQKAAGQLVEAADARRRDEIRAVFEHVRTIVAQRILCGEGLSPMRLPDIMEGGPGCRVTISEAGHPRHDLWREFAPWLDENRLKGRVYCTHRDGSYLHEIVIEPT